MTWMMGYGILVVATWIILALRILPGLIMYPASITSARGRGSDDATFRETRPDQSPLVTVILTAKNEAASIYATLSSLREQSWPSLEVIAVNDRSTDATGAILDQVAASWPDLQVIHIKELPQNWLGKNHALHVAAKRANGDWLLFTDADVHFSPDAVHKAIQFVRQTDIHHLALAPNLKARGFWLRAVILFFFYNVMILFRPQNAANPKSSAYVGIGAFNLVKKSTYMRVGGHGLIALRSDDDLALGELIKRNGFRQVFADGSDMLAVEWYQTLRDMARGLEKNALAPFQYRYGRFAIGMIAAFLFYDSPALGTILVHGWARGLFLVAWMLEVFVFHLIRKYGHWSLFWAFTIPIAAPILLVILVRSAVLCYIRGGVWWRGTFYSIFDLRRADKESETQNRR